MATIAKNSASARLLAIALESGASILDVSDAIGLPPELVEDYLALRERMPIAAQLALAAWVERRFPPLAPRARRLRAQASAAAAMERGDTVRHAHPPDHA